MFTNLSEGLDLFIFVLVDDETKIPRQTSVHWKASAYLIQRWCLQGLRKWSASLQACILSAVSHWMSCSSSPVLQGALLNFLDTTTGRRLIEDSTNSFVKTNHRLMQAAVWAKPSHDVHLLQQLCHIVHWRQNVISAWSMLRAEGDMWLRARVCPLAVQTDPTLCPDLIWVLTEAW